MRSRDYVNTWGPPGFCDACERSCMSLCQAGSIEEEGIRCYHCGQGRFRHRSLWRRMICPACNGQSAWCEWCRGDGVLPVPIE